MNLTKTVAKVATFALAFTAADAARGQCQVEKLTAFDAAADDEFGGRVSINGVVAVVGANWDDHAGGVNAGSRHPDLEHDYTVLVGFYETEEAR